MKNNYWIKDEVVYIDLFGQGKQHVCLIDKEDLDKIATYKGKWFATYSKSNDTFYVQINTTISGKRKLLWMHRIIMDTPNDLQVDHKNHNTLDNRKCNLRNVTQLENLANKQKYKRNSSGISNVYWHERDQKWIAQFQREGKYIYVGKYDDLAEASMKITQAKKVYNEGGRDAINKLLGRS
jgi:hypothetical protein